MKTNLLYIITYFFVINICAQSISPQSDGHNKLSSNNSTNNDDSLLPRVLLDDKFDDWESFPNLAPNTTGAESQPVLKVINDGDFLYIYFETDSILSLQNNNSLTLFIDSDDNSKTGKNVDGLGAEIEFRFGEREGTIYKNNKRDTIGVGDLFLIISPNIWSDKHEISISLKSLSGGKKLFTTEKISILIQDIATGKSIPAVEGGALYTIKNYNFTPLKTYSIEKQSDNFIRVLSHNVEFSSFFREDRKDEYRRMYKAIQPDIIGFSELYPDYKLEDVTTRLEEILPSAQGKTWKAKRTADNVIATRYSFKEYSSAGPFGNGAFLLDLRPRFNSDLLVMVAHPSCCDNDSSRQDEVDAIAAFIRDSKASGAPFNLRDKTPIIIMGDMNFVGDPSQLKTLLEGDIIQEDIYGEDYSPDWDGSFFEDSKPLSANLPHTFIHTSSGRPGTYSNGRLDYIIYSGSVLDLKNSFVMFTPAMPHELLTKYDIQNKDSENASDHLPLIGDFQLIYEQEETSIYTLRQNDKDGVPLNINSVQTVTGIVTASLELGDDGIVFVQNDQAAIVVNGDIVEKLKSGDFITITGDISQRSGLTLLTCDLQASQLVVHEKVTVPKPRVVTIADVHGQEWNGRELLEGRLIKIENVKILSSGNFKSDSKYYMTDDIDTLEIKIDSNIDLVNTPIPSEHISITGCLVQNKSSAPYDQDYLFFPRSREDVDIIKGIEHVPILTLRQNDSQGVPIYNDSAKTVSGIVTATNQFGRNGPAIIQNKEAGIALYGSAYVSKLNMGDSITVTGPLILYRGITEYTFDAEISEVITHKNAAVPDPQLVTISDILNQEWNGVELLESKLIMVKDVKFLDQGVFTSYRNYQITDGVNKIDMRIGRAGRLNGTNIPTGNISVIAIVSQNKSSAPFKGGYQLLPRSVEDIIFGN